MRLRLLFLRDCPGFAAAFLLDRLGASPLPDALGTGILLGPFLKGLVEPPPPVTAGRNAEIAENLPVRPGLERADFLLALDEDGERGRLDPPRGGLLEAAGVPRIEGRQRPRAVDADQPVALRAGDRRVGQRPHLLVRAQMLEGGADGLWGHRLQPEPADRLLDAGLLDHVAENEFPFAPGVAGVDQRIDVGPLDQPLEQVEAGLRFLNRLEIELLREHWQVLQVPLPALDLNPLGDGKFHQMPDGRRDDRLVALEEVAVLLEAA